MASAACAQTVHTYMTYIMHNSITPAHTHKQRMLRLVNMTHVKYPSLPLLPALRAKPYLHTYITYIAV